MEIGARRSQGEKTPTGRIRHSKSNTVPFCYTSPLPSQDRSSVDEPGDVMDNETPNWDGNSIPVNPQAPAAAPDLSLSDADDAQHKTNQQEQTSSPRRPRRRGPKINAPKPPTIEEMFGVNSDSWTRFFTITIKGDLDNVEIYEELRNTLKDDFDCYRRKDNTIIIDAKTKRNKF